MPFQREIADLPNADLLIGIVHLDRNHWAGVILRTQPPEFIFLEPFGRETSDVGRRLLARYTTWATKWNQNHRTCFPTRIDLVHFKHDRQADTTSCGIWTCVLIERVLKAEPLVGIDIVREGGRMASCILDASGDLSHICCYCGLRMASVDKVSCVMCRFRSFHATCVKYAWEGEFSCEICDPGHVSPLCTRCSLKKPADAEEARRAVCQGNCGRFVHVSCLYNGENGVYDCLVCDRVDAIG